MLGEFLRIGRLGLVHRLRDDLERVVIAPRLVVGQLAVFLLESVDVSLGARRVDQVVPHKRPDAGEVALAGAPGDDGVKAEAGHREFQPILGILLEEVGDLVAGEVRRHDIGLRLADFEQVGREIGRVGRDQLVAGQRATVLLQEASRDFRQVVAEGVVRRQRVPFLSLHQIIAQEITADTFHIHRIRSLDVEHVWITARSPQRVRIASGVDEHGLQTVRHLSDGEAGGRRDFADDHHHLVALDQAFGLG